MNLQETVNGVGVTMMILGLPGSGKTASLRNLSPEETLIITSEPHGLRTLLQYDWQEARVINPRTKQDWQEVTSKARVEQDVKHIVIDTISSTHDLFLENYINQKKTQGKQVESLGLDMYRVTNLQFQEVMREILQLPLSGVNVVMICHMKYRTDENNKQMKEPALSDNLTNWLCRQCDIILRSERIITNEKEKYLFRKKGAAGDFGSDKTGTVKDTEKNDVDTILKRCTNKKKPLEKKEKKKETVFENKTKPKKSANGAYKRFVDVASQAPQMSLKEARKWLETESGTAYNKLTAKQYEKLTKKFSDTFIPNF